jgi:hypothetical protein
MRHKNKVVVEGHEWEQMERKIGKNAKNEKDVKRKKGG